jgi:L-lactate dehydrogenase complex protein LldG
MPAAREQILADIRRSLPVDAPLPELAGPWTCYDDAPQKFFEMLRTVGGVGQFVSGHDELRREIERVIAQVGALRIASLVPEAHAGNIDVAAVDDPHQLADVDLAIVPGELAVAENAAVWVTQTAPARRILYFLSQHVVFVVPAFRVVNNMHEAYEWHRRQAGEGRPPFAEPRFGTYVSGPSKTADIEQALVIGAHGARSLHVFLVKEQ